MHNKLLIITSYPERGKTHGMGTVGIASYAKNTIKSVQKLKIRVLAERFGEEKEIYKEDGIEVRRVWKRNSPFLYLSLFKEIFSFKSTKNILIEFELAMFGDIFVLSFFPFFLFLLSILNKNIFLVAHQVIENISLLSGHINIAPKSLKAKMINLGIGVFYRLTFVFTTKIIVFQNDLKDKLALFAKKEKIETIAHGVEVFKTKLNKKEARKKLDLKNELVILYFGFIAWYKGADWIVKQFKRQTFNTRRLKLIIAGGENPNHKDKKYYRKYVQKIKKEAENSNDKILITGFVPEEEIPLYFLASDVAIFPYRAAMSASGPLSIAFSFQKPFLVSDQMAGVFEDNDIKSLLKKHSINKKDLTFSLKNGDFGKKIKKFKDKAFISKLRQLARDLGKMRSFKKIGEEYFELLAEDLS